MGDDILGSAAKDFSGQAVSINQAGNRVFIGSPLPDHASTEGHVRVFELEETCTPVRKLL